MTDSFLIRSNQETNPATRCGAQPGNTNALRRGFYSPFLVSGSQPRGMCRWRPASFTSLLFRATARRASCCAGFPNLKALRQNTSKEPMEDLEHAS